MNRYILLASIGILLIICMFLFTKELINQANLSQSPDDFYSGFFLILKWGIIFTSVFILYISIAIYFKEFKLISSAVVVYLFIGIVLYLQSFFEKEIIKSNDSLYKINNFTNNNIAKSSYTSKKFGIYFEYYNDESIGIEPLNIIETENSILLFVDSRYYGSIYFPDQDIGIEEFMKNRNLTVDSKQVYEYTPLDSLIEPKKIEHIGIYGGISELPFPDLVLANWIITDTSESSFFYIYTQVRESISNNFYDYDIKNSLIILN